MPDLVGCTLQEAELAIRDVTGGDPAVRTRLFHASEPGPEPLAKSDWRVCRQFPEVGSWIRVGTDVSLQILSSG